MEKTSIELHVTKDYSTFKLLKGNRPLDKHHIASLKKKIETEGNLTTEFPVNINERGEVVDGQHRVAALAELKYPVYYTITKGAGLAVVRQINVARKNWNWLDYANSYAEEGLTAYKDIIGFYEGFGFGQHTLTRYCNGGKGVSTKTYQEGEFKVLDKGLTWKLLTQLKEINETLPFPAIQSLNAAMYDVMTHPNYDHKRMLNKLTQHGSQLRQWSKKKDWFRNLEDIYNMGMMEANRVRFF